MANSLISMLQGGSGTSLQDATPTLQGSSSSSLQQAANPNNLNPNANIIVPESGNVKGASTEKVNRNFGSPNPPAPTNPNATVAPKAPEPVDKSRDIAQNLAGLDATNIRLSGGLQSIKDAIANLLGQYSNEYSQANDVYGSNSVTNKSNFLANQQSALTNAAQGRQGLYGLLSSLGALSGSGIALANNAVQNKANEDIANSNTDFKTNQDSLDTSFSQFDAANKARKQEAEDARIANENALRASIAQSQQGYYTGLSNDYADMGNTGEANKYSDLAKSLFPTIATNSTPSSIPSYTPSTYVAPSLSKSMSSGSTVSSTPATGLSSLPGLMAYIAPNKKQQTV